jgi:hypothetical protein
MNKTYLLIKILLVVIILFIILQCLERIYRTQENFTPHIRHMYHSRKRKWRLWSEEKWKYVEKRINIPFSLFSIPWGSFSLY